MISEVSPQTSSLFVDPATKISFVANDDKGALLDGISVTLNGVLHTASSGLTIEGPDNARKVSLGGLQANRSYHAEIKVLDAEGESDTRYLFFDTFDKDSFVVEIEDYNFDGGDFIAKPVIIPELDEDGDLNWDENAYLGTEGYSDIDYSDKNEIPQEVNHRYRPFDGVATAPALDLDRPVFLDAGGKDKGVFDYSVGEIEEGEWLNYTRNYPKGDYLVYLRQAQFSIEKAISTLELVTGATDEKDQSTKLLGTFIGSESGVEYRNVLLTNKGGTKPIVVTLDGEQTLRLTQKTTDENDTYLKQNFLIFINYTRPTVELQVSDPVQGPYKTDSGAKIDEAAKTITLGQAGTTQFYRLGGVTARITDIRLVGGDVVLSYE